jgi:hypothetical protein
MLKKLTSCIKSLPLKTKSLLGLWVLFVLLVAFGIHGSATGVTADWWAPEKPYTGYLFNPPKDLSKVDAGGLQEILMAKARWIRWDELLIATPLSLSQLSHNPRFPVVNTNIANGQNMLTFPRIPVWHVVTLARPATWGYFIFGAQRGLAWHWWFQVFSCFTVLYLLLEIILKGHRGLAAFGAFWYCASAYNVCWSLWPSQVTFFAALGCLSAYHLLAAQKKSFQIICATLLGLSIPGFVMFLYPPWQVSLAYVFLFVFAGLFIRDKLYLSFKPVSKHRLLSLTVAFLLAGGLTLSFLFTCLPDLKLMANTVYPGKRISPGGDYSFAMLFKGMYNLRTVYEAPQGLVNQCEASSFYYLFPGVFLSILLSKRLARKLGILGWLLVAFLAGMLFFLLVGLPEKVAKLTLMSYVPPYRADAAIGFASIVLCIYVLALIKDLNKETRSTWDKAMPLIVAAIVIPLFIYHGLVLMKVTGGFPSSSTILALALFVGLLSYFLLAGRGAAFCVALGAILVATAAFFNPLSTNLDHIYESELAQQIVKLNKESPDRPLWICYGGVHPGMLIITLGGRSLSGVHWPPQLALWRSIDPSGGGYEPVYNRYAQVQLNYRPDNNWVSFSNSQDDAMDVSISPTHPVLLSMGARYVLAMGPAQATVSTSNLPIVYKSETGRFTIFEIPPNDHPQSRSASLLR